ncbi:hypothetical protein IscW_ISCW020469 [Ixodes scapularis]|uniref:Mab-21-like nucleotidyltransferase domain-containing protein n=1 Tax=Ixodes scapularis TaxID=6945 RepID=B7Q2E3_IXOSC|nr:hypothetical protein IscW_ISCW020469 [Ixodes scapularis]|eukprot:XP_002410739.1 hypothetical protein IscW_ISCW020469 [Ixodes scapularis]
MGMLLHFNDAERELNAKLKPHLHSIHASLKLNQDITDANVAILKTILDDIYEQIKRNDPLFKKICRRLVYTGSYYIRLRTKKADEFDINLVLDLPFRKGEFTILDERPGYVGYKVSPAAVNRLLQEGEKEWVHPLLKLINGENRLVPERVKRSLQSAFDRVLQTYVIPSGLRSSVARVLERLGLALAQLGPAIPFLFHPEVDLAEKVKKATREDISNAIRRIVHKLRESPDKCCELILKNEPVLESLGHALDQPGPAIPFLFHPKVDLTEKIKIPTKRNISGTIKHIVRKLRESPDRCCELILGESGMPAPPNDVTQEAKFLPYMVHQTENSGGAWRCLIS